MEHFRSREGLLQLCRQVQVGLDCSERDGKLLVLSKADIGSRRILELNTPDPVHLSHPHHQYPRHKQYSEEYVGSYSNKIYDTNLVENYVTPAPPSSSDRSELNSDPGVPGELSYQSRCRPEMRTSCKNVTRTVYLEETESDCSVTMETVTVCQV